jgi:hypothetical protein
MVDVSIKHKKVSNLPDSSDTDLVRPSDWNDTHDIENLDEKIEEKINEIFPYGIGANIIVLAASEALAADDVVNIYDDTGTTKCRKANATNATKPAHGYVKASVESGSNATVYLDGLLPGTGLTVGSSYFLSTTGGLVTTTPPSSTGNVWQKIGNAVDTDKIEFEPEDPIIRV